MNNIFKKIAGQISYPPYAPASDSNLALRRELMRHGAQSQSLQSSWLHKMQGVKATL